VHGHSGSHACTNIQQIHRKLKLRRARAADVLTIENSRSGDAMLHALTKAGYSRDVGPGVYDVHSPVVPTTDFVRSKVESFVKTGIVAGDARRIWINPDCGLKTRGWAEVLPSLRNLVRAAEALRATVPAAA
jgi:5-methyltetrahydropteroyltriglutamate--homocysteine methyltransferase